MAASIILPASSALAATALFSLALAGAENSPEAWGRLRRERA